MVKKSTQRKSENIITWLKKKQKNLHKDRAKAVFRCKFRSLKCYITKEAMCTNNLSFLYHLETNNKKTVITKGEAKL